MSRLRVRVEDEQEEEECKRSLECLTRDLDGNEQEEEECDRSLRSLTTSLTTALVGDEQEEEECKRSLEYLTMDLVREAADSVFPWLEFTADIPENHKTCKVPMLDLQVWVEHHHDHRQAKVHKTPASGPETAPASPGTKAGPTGSGAPVGSEVSQPPQHPHPPASHAPVGGPEATPASPGTKAGPTGSGAPVGSEVSQPSQRPHPPASHAPVGDPEATPASPGTKAGPTGSGAPVGSEVSQPSQRPHPPASHAPVGDPEATPASPGTKAGPTGSGAPVGSEVSQPPQPPHPPVSHAPVGVSDTLCWMFYEKPTSSCRLLKATSAYTWRSKIVTMNMEVFRRLRNTSRQVTIGTRVRILNEFTAKLKASGYITSTINGIITSGVAFYYRKLREDLQGGRPLNLRNDSNDVARKRAKLGASERWFRRRRGGEKEDI